MSLRLVVLVGSIVSTGLMAGLFFGWAVSVIPGTAAVDDRTYVLTMQNINREILNPAFLVAFVVTPLVLVATAILEARAGNTRRATTLAAAATTYLIGVFAVTAGGNVPLNNALEGFDLADATVDQIQARRTSYETRWNQWHNLRTVASIGSLVLAAVACTISEVE